VGAVIAPAVPPIWETLPDCADRFTFPAVWIPAPPLIIADLKAAIGAEADIPAGVAEKE